MADSNPLPEPAADVMFQQFDDGAVLFSTIGEVYFGLNAVGATVWTLLPTAASLEALCEEVAVRHPGAELERVRREVGALLDDLGREGLVRAPGDGDATPQPSA